MGSPQALAYASVSGFPTTTTMSALTVHIKHGGKQHTLQLDPEQPPSVFKEAIYQATGVPVDRMKVMIKGSLLKVGFILLRKTRARSNYILPYVRMILHGKVSH